MKTITISQKDITQQVQDKVAVKYKHLKPEEFTEKVSAEFGMDLYFQAASLKVKNNETVILKFILEEMQEPFEMKATKVKGEFMINYNSLTDSLGIPLDERQEGLKVALNQFLTLKSDEAYHHPLGDYTEEKGKTMLNMYLTACFMINSVRNVFDDGDPLLAERHLTKMLNTINPLVDANSLIADIKLHKVIAMQKIANIIGTAPHQSIINSMEMKID